MANSISVLGRAGADSEVAYSKDGTPILKIRLASDVGYGEKKTTNWFSVSLFGKRAEKLASSITKGSQLMIVGELEQREYTDKQGVVKYSLDIKANDLFFAGSKGTARNDNVETAANDNAEVTASKAHAGGSGVTGEYSKAPFGQAL